MRRRWITLASLTLACGPSVEADDPMTTTTTESADDDDDDDDDGGSPGPSSATDPNPSTTTSTETTTSDAGTTEDVGDEAGFIAQRDGGDEAECDIWIDDCPSGTKCMPLNYDGGGWNTTKCMPLADDPRDVGEPCTAEGDGTSGVDDCVARAMCRGIDPDTNMGECVAFCEGSEANPTCADPCSECILTSEGLLILCLPICDPIAQDCGQGEGCYTVGSGFACVPDASAAGGGLGEPCEFINACDPGLHCAEASALPDCTHGGLGCCTPLCDTSADDPCPSSGPDVECIPWSDQPPCTPVTAGVCILPE